ncbi:glycoside hydrolase family 172 protein [Blautia sp. 1033sp1_1033st1_G9_1033SCRN_220408]|uniref:glycoside hydrolase family 172 protein n=1 Tax=Blautia sp. 1033sp1_1033st1_G9_1033SCRN_220408 TaxID=3144490 RepID=UPI0034A486B0
MNLFGNIFPYGKFGSSRAINGENPTGEKGKGGMASGSLGKGRKGHPCFTDIAPGSTTVLADIHGCGVINHIWITVDNKTSQGDCFVLRDLILQMIWDEEEYPAVEVPLGDFFCCGFGKECMVNSYPIAVVPSRGLNCYFPMPFRKRAQIRLISQHKNPVPAFFYQIDYCLYDSLPDPVFYFHAKWNREPVTCKKKDYTILDGVHGKGIYVGTYIALQTLERYWWGEGEVKFYLDGDKDYPTICGTGMEDYVGGSWSFASPEPGKMKEQTYSTPFLGYPYYSAHDDLTTHPYHNDDCPPMRGMYRFHIPDPIYFQEDIRVTVQQIGMSHNGLFERQDDVSSVAYWYQMEGGKNRYEPLPPKEERWPR